MKLAQQFYASVPIHKRLKVLTATCTSVWAHVGLAEK